MTDAHLERISKSMETINHNTTITAEAVKNIAANTGKLNDVLIAHSSTTKAEHSELKNLFSRVIMVLIGAIATFAGIKLLGV